MNPMNPADFDPSLPLSRARTVPASWYSDPAVYALERERVFAGSWQMVGRLDSVRDPGDYFTCELADEPILVVRDGEGILRAFYNVCRHRAAPLLTEPCGHATKLRCRYHGWTYDLAGKLRGVPEFDGVEDFDRESFGLREIPLDTFGGLVWIRPGGGEVTQTLAEFLSPIPEWMRSRNVDLGELKFVRRVSYDLKCNWKVYVDNYLDGGYHIHTVHPGLAGVIDYSRYRTTVYPSTSLQSSPLTGGEADDAANRTRKGDLAAYWWVWPNFMLNLYDGVMDTNLVLPLGPEACRVVFDFYFREVEGTQAFMDESIAVGEQIQREDIDICEEVQKGLKSRSYTTGRFSVKREIAGHHFHRLLGERLLRS